MFLTLNDTDACSEIKKAAFMQITGFDTDVVGVTDGTN